VGRAIGNKKGIRPSARWVLFVGTEFAVIVGGLGYIGYWIDSRYGSDPWGVLAGAGVGLIGGTYNLIRECLAAIQQPDARNDDYRTRP